MLSYGVLFIIDNVDILWQDLYINNVFVSINLRHDIPRFQQMQNTSYIQF